VSDTALIVSPTCKGDCIASVTSSPLFSTYGETISGLTVIRAFGMSTKFLKDMIICADTVRMSGIKHESYCLTRHPRTLTQLIGPWDVSEYPNFDQNLEPVLLSVSLAVCSVPNGHRGLDGMYGINHPLEPLY